MKFTSNLIYFIKLQKIRINSKKEYKIFEVSFLKNVVIFLLSWLMMFIWTFCATTWCQCLQCIRAWSTIFTLVVLWCFTFIWDVVAVWAVWAISRCHWQNCIILCSAVFTEVLFFFRAFIENMVMGRAFRAASIR